MDNEQARIILSAYRPGGRDASDPHFAEALAQAQRDPALGRWLAEEQALDAGLAARLKAAPVPDDLLPAILAGQRIARPEFRSRRTALLAAAAAIAVLITLSLLPPRTPGAGFAEFRADMMTFLNGLDRLDHVSRDAGELREWLASHSGQAEFVLPKQLASSDTIGCRVIEWRGRKATLVCLRSGPGQTDGKVHLLVVDRAELNPAPPTGQPQLEQLGRWAVAGWSDDRRSYLLAGLGSTEAIRKLF